MLTPRDSPLRKTFRFLINYKYDLVSVRAVGIKADAARSGPAQRPSNGKQDPFRFAEERVIINCWNYLVGRELSGSTQMIISLRWGFSKTVKGRFHTGFISDGKSNMFMLRNYTTFRPVKTHFLFQVQQPK